MSTFTRNYGDLKMIERTICKKVDDRGTDVVEFLSDISKPGRCRQLLRRHIIRFKGYDIDSIDYMAGNY